MKKRDDNVETAEEELMEFGFSKTSAQPNELTPHDRVELESMNLDLDLPAANSEEMNGGNEDEDEIFFSGSQSSSPLLSVCSADGDHGEADFDAIGDEDTLIVF